MCSFEGFQYFSLPVDLHGRTVLGEKRKKQIILETETLAAVTAFALWQSFFAGRRCVLFVDNEGTKFSLLKVSSDNDIVDLLAGYFAEYELLVHAFSWLARVPSKSNIADPPSRNDTSFPFFDNALNVSTKTKEVADLLISKILEDGEKGFETSQLGKRRVQLS